MALVFHNKIVSPRSFGRDSKSCQCGQKDLIVLGIELFGGTSALSGAHESETTVAEILVDGTATAMSPYQMDSVFLHLVGQALGPNVLPSTDDDASVVSPQKKDPAIARHVVEDPVFGGQVEIGVVCFR